MNIIKTVTAMVCGGKQNYLESEVFIIFIGEERLIDWWV